MRYVDFHSLRVPLSTRLAANKGSPRAAQALMRHTDPRLTASVYTDEGAKAPAAPADAAVQFMVAGRPAAARQSVVHVLPTR